LLIALTLLSRVDFSRLPFLLLLVIQWYFW